MTTEKAIDRYKILLTVVGVTILAFALLVSVVSYLISHGRDGGLTSLFNATSLLYDGIGYILYASLFFTIIGVVLSKKKRKTERLKGFRLSFIYLVTLTITYWIILYFNL